MKVAAKYAVQKIVHEFYTNIRNARRHTYFL